MIEAIPALIAICLMLFVAVLILVRALFNERDLYYHAAEIYEERLALDRMSLDQLSRELIKEARAAKMWRGRLEREARAKRERRAKRRAEEANS